MEGTCEICEREGMKLDRHHLIPRTRHRKKATKKKFTREDVTTRILHALRISAVPRRSPWGEDG